MGSWPWGMAQWGCPSARRTNREPDTMACDRVIRLFPDDNASALIEPTQLIPWGQSFVRAFDADLNARKIATPLECSRNRVIQRMPVASGMNPPPLCCDARPLRQVCAKNNRRIMSPAGNPTAAVRKMMMNCLHYTAVTRAHLRLLKPTAKDRPSPPACPESSNMVDGARESNCRNAHGALVRARSIGNVITCGRSA